MLHLGSNKWFIIIIIPGKSHYTIDRSPEQVVEDGLLDRHSGFEQHREVADLVGELVAKNGDGGRQAGHETFGEGGADGKTVGEVVDAVANNHHPG